MMTPVVRVGHVKQCRLITVTVMYRATDKEHAFTRHASWLEEGKAEGKWTSLHYSNVNRVTAIKTFFHLLAAARRLYSIDNRKGVIDVTRPT